MKHLFLVRHGATDANASGVLRGWSNDPLSDLGRAQAERLARRLTREAPINALYTSTLQRSQETGLIVARALGLTIQPRDDLRELNLGSFEGRGERELWGYFMQAAASGARDLSAMPDVTFPQGESVRAFVQRVRTAFGEISRLHPGESVLVVAHGVLIMTALGLWFERDLARWPRFRMDNCSLTQVAFDPEPRLIRVNDTSHLAE